MKIIQGKYKGIILKGFDINGTRPTMDRVKESLFAMIQDKVYGSMVLDLFAGSGNLGIEALSMGAKDCYFVDKNNIACKIIKENLNKVNEDRKVFQSDFKQALKSFDTKFDLIFLDPPYNTEYINECIQLINKYELLNNNGLIICESNNKDKITTLGEYDVLKEKKYGDKFVVILKNSNI